MRRAVPLLVVLLLSPAAHAVTVLTAGKQAAFRAESALIRVGRDRALATLADPTCAGGAPTTVQVASYPQATARLAATPRVTLDCARWRKAGARYLYEDDDGAALGVRRIELGSAKLVIRLGGPNYQAPPGPVGYAEAWLGLGDRRLLVRVHNFARNTATLVVARKTSAPAAAGEAAFWDVLHGDDRSEARQQDAIRSLTRAVRRDRRDGRSWFLLAMTHLYRFGVRTSGYSDVSAEARAELDAAAGAFARATPLLWDGTHGDSRVPGFAAATKFVQGVVSGDEALAAEGLAELDAAIAANPFFNVFDLIPVIQAVPRTDPRFAAAYATVKAYLDEPETLLCVTNQTEICANDGLAPRNISGSLLLFGDVLAKNGDLAGAQGWYDLARLGTAPGYRFATLLDDRTANAAARVAAYLDGDPANDPQVVGLGEENCATCHNR